MISLLEESSETTTRPLVDGESISFEEIKRSLAAVQEWVERREYRGYEPFDGLSSWLRPLTTDIFDAAPLLEINSSSHVRFTVNTRSAKAILHLSKNTVAFTAQLSCPTLKIVIMSSGIGSCKSSITFDPNNLGTSAAKTSTSGILCMWTTSYRLTGKRRVNIVNAIRMNRQYWST